MTPGLAKAAPLTPSPRHLDGLRANVAVGLLEARDGAVAQAPDHCHQRVEVLKLQQLLGDKRGAVTKWAQNLAQLLWRGDSGFLERRDSARLANWGGREGTGEGQAPLLRGRSV